MNSITKLEGVCINPNCGETTYPNARKKGMHRKCYTYYRQTGQNRPLPNSQPLGTLDGRKNRPESKANLEKLKSRLEALEQTPDPYPHLTQMMNQVDGKTPQVTLSKEDFEKLSRALTNFGREVQRLKERLQESKVLRDNLTESVKTDAYREGYEDGVHDTINAASIERGVEKPANKYL